MQDSNRVCQILILTLKHLTTSFFQPKMAQTGKKVIAFFRYRGKEIELCFFYIWIDQRRKLFPNRFTFFDSGHLQAETGSESWTKSANFDSLMFLYNLEFFKYYSNVKVLCLKTTSGENLCKIGQYCGE